MTKNDIEPRTVSVVAPYELPEGWKWTRLGECSSVISKGTTPKGGKDAYLKEGVNFLRIENLNDDGSINHSNISHISQEEHEGNLKRSRLEAGDLLVSIAGTLGKVGFVTETDLPMNTNQAIAFVRLHKDIFDNMYLKYAIESPFVNAKLLSKTKVTSIPNLTLEIISNCIIPLPPTLAEQQRIVSRIESLFAKLDEAKDKAQSVVDGFELRRAAVLHKAFTGELTAKWRKEHGVSDDSWEEKTIGDCLFPMTTKMPSGETFRYIDIESIDNKTQTVKNPKIIAVSEAPSRASRELKENDVLFSMVRPYLKNIAVIDKSLCDCIASTGFYVCRCNGMLNYRYLYNLLCSKDAIDYLMQFMKGDNSPSIRKNDLLEMSINLPTLAEQQEIVRILDSVLEKEADAKEIAEEVLEQIGLLKKSILARAFRGEL